MVKKIVSKNLAKKIVKNFGQNSLGHLKFLVSKSFRSAKIFGNQRFLSAKCFVCGNFLTKKFLVSKIFLSAKISDQQKFSQQKKLCSKFLVSKNFKSVTFYIAKKILVSEIFWSAKIFGQLTNLLTKLPLQDFLGWVRGWGKAELGKSD